MIKFLPKKALRMRMVGGVLAGSALACRPVITVGWSEILILALIILIAFFPLLLKIFRFYLRLEGKKRDREDDADR